VSILPAEGISPVASASAIPEISLDLSGPFSPRSHLPRTSTASQAFFLQPHPLGTHVAPPLPPRFSIHRQWRLDSAFLP